MTDRKSRIRFIAATAFIAGVVICLASGWLHIREKSVVNLVVLVLAVCWTLQLLVIPRRRSLGTEIGIGIALGTLYLLSFAGPI